MALALLNVLASAMLAGAIVNGPAGYRGPKIVSGLLSAILFTDALIIGGIQ